MYYDFHINVKEIFVMENVQSVLDYEKLVNDFRILVSDHDLYYQYSDDFRYWSSGNESILQIRALAAKLPKSVADEIWNEIISKKYKIEPGSLYF
jgi:hypothetical protein